MRDDAEETDLGGLFEGDEVPEPNTEKIKIEEYEQANAMPRAGNKKLFAV